MDEDTITRNNDLNIGIMKDESPERGILADSIAPTNSPLINTKIMKRRKTSMPKVPLIGNSQLLRDFEK